MMNTKDIYSEVKELLRLAYEDDDLMEQENLFEMQERLTDLALKLALDCKMGKDLVDTFPYLYHVTEKKG